jgi:hypothetical protein
MIDGNKSIPEETIELAVRLMDQEIGVGFISQITGLSEETVRQIYVYEISRRRGKENAIGISHVSKQAVKPPIGLSPRQFHSNDRLQEVCGAITRYYEAGLPIELEWIEEYNDLVTYLNKQKK